MPDPAVVRPWCRGDGFAADWLTDPDPARGCGMLLAHAGTAAAAHAAITALSARARFGRLGICPA
jgi:hypothetical protein